MSTNDYKYYKRIKNYDIGVNPGYQKTQWDSDDFSVEQGVTPIRDQHVQGALAQSAQTVSTAASLLQEYKPWDYLKHFAMAAQYRGKVPTSALSTISTQATPDTINAGAKLAMPSLHGSSVAANTVGSASSTASVAPASSAATTGNVAGQGASSVGATAGSVVNKALPALAIAQGLFDTYKMYTNNQSLGGDDFLSMSERYRTPNGAEQIGGLDTSGAIKFGEHQKTASMINGAIGMTSTGLGFASYLAPATGGLSYALTPLFTLAGLGFGAIKGHKQKDLMKTRIELFRRGADAYNKQNESEQASEDLRASYYADNGLNLGTKRYDTGKHLGRVGAEEVWVKTNNNNKVVEAGVIPRVPGIHEPRRDDYVTEINDHVGIGGWKIDEDTGLPFTIEMRPYVQAFNQATNRSEKKRIGDILLAHLDKQETTPNNNPSPYETLGADNGKNMKKHNINKRLPKYDTGVPTFGKMAPYAITPMLEGLASTWAQLRQDQKSPIIYKNPHVPNTSTAKLLQNLPVLIDVSDQVRSTNDVLSQARNQITQSGAISPGMRQALLGNLFINKMRTLSDIYNYKTKQENENSWKKGELAYRADESNTARAQQGNEYAGSMEQQARGAKYKALAQYGANLHKIFNQGFADLSTLQQFLANVGLFREDLDLKRKQLVNNLSNNAGSKGGFTFTPMKWTPKTDLSTNIFPQQGLWNLFNRGK